MATTSEWTGWVEATTDADPAAPTGASEWTGWVEATTDAGSYRLVRRAGVWVAVTDRQVRRSGVWT